MPVYYLFVKSFRNKKFFKNFACPALCVVYNGLMKTMPIDPVAEYPKVEKMLLKLVWKFTEEYPISFEEALSEAYNAFVKACYTYKPERGTKFSSWCYFVVWGNLKTAIMKRTEDPLVFVEINEDLMGAAPPEIAPCLEVVDLLSPNARRLVELILDPPPPIRGKAMAPSRLAKRVRDYMIRQGISRKAVEEAFKEVQQALRAFWNETEAVPVGGSC